MFRRNREIKFFLRGRIIFPMCDCCLWDLVAFTHYTVNQNALESLITADTPRLIVNYLVSVSFEADIVKGMLGRSVIRVKETSRKFL